MESITFRQNYSNREAFTDVISKIDLKTTALEFYSVTIADKDIYDTDIKNALARCPSLTSLTIDNCPNIRLEGIELPQITNLQTLYLLNSSITDAEIETLNLQKCHKLREISFHSCQNVCLNEVKLPWNQIDRLSIRYTNVSWKTVAAIQLENPSLNVWVSSTSTQSLNQPGYYEVTDLGRDLLIPGKELSPTEFSKILYDRYQTHKA